MDRLESNLERNIEAKLLERSLGPEENRGFGFDRLHLGSASNRAQCSTCFVFYLPPSATSETLRQLFMRYGMVLNAYVAVDKLTNHTKGFGFVDFTTSSEAQAAVAGLNRHFLDGKYLSVSIKV